MKKSLILLPSLLVPILGLSSCTVHTGGGSEPIPPEPEPTEAGQMIITKSADTLFNGTPVTITIDSTTGGEVSINSVTTKISGFSVEINSNKATINLNGYADATSAVIWTVNATNDGIPMEEQTFTLIVSSSFEYSYTTTENYLTDMNAIYTELTKGVNFAESDSFAIEHKLSLFGNIGLLKECQNLIFIRSFFDTTFEISNLNCRIVNKNESINITNYVEQRGRDLWEINIDEMQIATGHELGLDDSIILFLTATNTGTFYSPLFTVYF